MGRLRKVCRAEYHLGSMSLGAVRSYLEWPFQACLVINTRSQTVCEGARVG